MAEHISIGALVELGGQVGLPLLHEWFVNSKIGMTDITYEHKISRSGRDDGDIRLALTRADQLVFEGFVPG